MGFHPHLSLRTDCQLGFQSWSILRAWVALPFRYLEMEKGSAPPSAGGAGDIPDRMPSVLSLPRPWQWMGNEIQQHSEQVHMLGNQQCTSWIVPICWAPILYREEKSTQVPQTWDFSQDISLLTSTSHFCKPQLLWTWPEFETDATVQKPGLPDTGKIVSKVCGVFQETDGPFGSCPEENSENNVREDQRHWGFLVLKREAQDISIAFKCLESCFKSERISPWTLGIGQEVLV